MKDIELLKKNNFNALRFSHYPDCRRLCELCDEFEFYVVSECDIESHGMGYSTKKTIGGNLKWLVPHMERTKNNYKRTKNHACVTIYSLGNEAKNGSNFYETYKYIKENEEDGQNRPFNYERALFDWNTDMYVPMHPSVSWFEQSWDELNDKPIVPCEYSHAIGNSNGNFDRLWRVIYEHPNLQGGFIWDWVDQGILEVGKGGRKYWTYGGDYGVNMPSHGNFNINGCLNPDRNPHPAMAEFKYSQQNVGFAFNEVGDVEITNRYYFTDLNDFEVFCLIMENEKIVNELNLSDSNKELESLGPQKSIKINFGSEIKKLKPKIRTEYFLNFKVLAKNDKKPFIPKGFEIAHD